jgi:hypothetical protein
MSCFAHRHMTPQEFGVYKYIEAVSHESGVFYSDGHSMAKEFEAREGRTCKRLIDSLAKKGWLRLLVAPARNAQGIFTCAQYTLVEHEEWIKTHSNQCRRDPLPPVTTDNTAATCDNEQPLHPVAVETSIAASDNGNPLQLETPPLPPVSQPLPRVTTSIVTGGNKSSKAEVRKEKSEKKSQKQPLGTSTGSSKPSGQKSDESDDWKKKFADLVRTIGSRHAVNLLPVPAWVFEGVEEHGQEAGDWMLAWLNKRNDIRSPRKYWEWMRPDFEKQFSAAGVL